MENFWPEFLTFWAMVTNPEAEWGSMLLRGLSNTVLIAVAGLVIGIVLGALVAVIEVSPKRGFLSKVLDKICRIYVTIFRGTPMVVQLLVVYYIVLPLLGIKLEVVGVGIAVFGMNSGAYVSEIMRGGINSVDGGQMEAGRALGLGYWTTMLKIVIPQAVKNIIPTIGNEFITLIKETSVLSFITVFDLFTVFKVIGGAMYSVKVPYLTMAIIYIVLIVIITFIIKGFERMMAKSDRNKKGKGA